MHKEKKYTAATLKLDSLRNVVLADVALYYKAKASADAANAAIKPIQYAGRVYDEHEMINLVDSSLDFFLTAGRYAEQFETKLAKYLGLKHAALVNSG